MHSPLLSECSCQLFFFFKQKTAYAVRPRDWSSDVCSSDLNTGIATYVWVLSNKKSGERKGKVQLINGVNLCGKMRKSLGSKRNEMSEEDIRTITRRSEERRVGKEGRSRWSPYQ